MSGRPGWLDDSLAEEWVEPEEVDLSIDQEDDAIDIHVLSGSVLVSPGPQALSSSQPQLHSSTGQSPPPPQPPQHLIAQQQRHASASGSSVTAVPSSPSFRAATPTESLKAGTFLIREDIEHQPVTPVAQLPFGKGKAKGKKMGAFTKSIFTPLDLETMWDPPSPPPPRIHQRDQEQRKISPSRRKLQSPLIPLPRRASPSPSPKADTSDIPPDDAQTSHTPLASPSKLSIDIAPLDDSDVIVQKYDRDPSRSDEIVESDIPNLGRFNGRVPSANFTFVQAFAPEYRKSLKDESPPFLTSTPPDEAPVPRRGRLSRPGVGSVKLSRPPLVPGFGKLAMQTETETPIKFFGKYDTYTKDYVSGLNVEVKPSPPERDREWDEDGRSAKRIRMTAPESLSDDEALRTGTLRGMERTHLRSTLSHAQTAQHDSDPELSPEREPESRPSSRHSYLLAGKSILQGIRDSQSFSFNTTMSKGHGLGLDIADDEEYEDEDDDHADEDADLDDEGQEDSIPSPGPIKSSGTAYALEGRRLLAQLRSDEEEDDRFNSTQGQPEDLGDGGSELQGSFQKLSLSTSRDRPAKGASDDIDLSPIRSITPSIIVQPNSPTGSIPDVPPPLVVEPARESSISPRLQHPTIASQQQPSSSSRRPTYLPFSAPSSRPSSHAETSSRVPSSTTAFSASSGASANGRVHVQNRLVTASTIRSSTNSNPNSAGTQTSMGSNVKRAGSPTPRLVSGGARRQLVTIKPDDVGPIERVGQMRYDAAQNKWVKDRGAQKAGPPQAAASAAHEQASPRQSLKRSRSSYDGAVDSSDGDGAPRGEDEVTGDVFGDIESLHDGTVTWTMSSGPSFAVGGRSRTSSIGSAKSSTKSANPPRSTSSSHSNSNSRSNSSRSHAPSHSEPIVSHPPVASAPVPTTMSNSQDKGAEQFFGESEAEEDDFATAFADPDGGRTPSQLSVIPDLTEEVEEEDVEVANFSAASAMMSGDVTTTDLQRNFESTFSDEDEQELSNPNASFPELPTTPYHRQRAPMGISETPRPILVPSQSTPHPFPHMGHRARPEIPLIPPRSAMKQTPSTGQRRAPATPATNGKFTSTHRRSVSFSDGRTDGKMLSVNVSHLVQYEDASGDGSIDDEDMSAEEEEMEEEYTDEEGQAEQSAQSLRSRRVQGMLAALEEASLEESTLSRTHPRALGIDEASMVVPIPSRNSAFRRAPSDGVARAHAARPPAQGSIDSTSIETPDILMESPPQARGPAASQRTMQNRNMSAMTNQTILTEASFAITEDRLVQVITQVQPYEPHWEQLSEIHLAGFGIESVTNMKHYLPSLVTLDLHKNQLSYLTGVPPLVRTLRVSHNQLTDLASYAHLRDLEYLDISYNRVESLTQLSCLPRLHELRAEGNSIRSLDGLQGMTYLTKLSLKKNRLPSVNLGDYDWPRLEILDLSSNSISGIKGLSGLKRLSMLNLDHNKLTALNVSRPLSHLRILRLSDNRLPEFNAAPFVHLRTLYLDGNKLHHIHDLVRLVKLENLSLRNQAGGHLALNSRDIQDVKRLYLSGNPFTDLSFLTSACYNLIYLEVAGCRVSNLPPNLSSLIPNIRVLNLNYNFIADASPIQGLTRLKRLTLVGSRLKGTKTFLKVLRNMPDIEMIDVRMNPATLGWYLPLLVRDVPGALQPSESGTSYPLPAQDASDVEEDIEKTTYSAVRLHPFSKQTVSSGRSQENTAPSKGQTRSQTATWEDLDSKFRRDLPNDSYLGRLAYRGLVMRACPKVAIIDGVKVTPAERDKAEQYLRGVLEARHQALTKAT